MKTNRGELWLIVALTLAAAIFRPLDLLGRSMWLDEGATLMRIAGSWIDILSNTINLQGILMIDTHPPAYFVILKAWAILAGQSEFVLKWMSVIGGVLSVPLVYVMARRLINRSTAVIAATMMLLSPLLEWYSHEMRMYTVLVCFSALSTYALYNALYPRRGSNLALNWAGWVLAIGLAGSSHYPFIGLFVAHVVVGAITIARRPEKLRRVEISVLVVAVAVGLAIMVGAYFWPPTHDLFMRLSSGRERDYSFVPLDVIVQSILSGYVFGVNAVDPTGLVVLGSGLVCVVGALLPLDGSAEDRRTRSGRVLAAAAAVIPTLVWFAISFIKPNFQGVRHLILVVPGVAVLMASGIGLALRWRPAGARVLRLLSASVGALPILLLLISELYGSAYVFIHTPDWHDDWRGMADYVREHWQEGDVFVINSPVTAGTVTFYVPDLPTVVSPLVPFDADSPQAVKQRESLLARYKRIWFTNTGTGDNRDGSKSITWFNTYTFHRENVGFPTRTRFIDVDLFEVKTPVSDILPASAQPVDAGPGPLGAVIAGYDIRPGNSHSIHSNLWLSLYWKRVDTSNVSQHSASVRFMDAQGIDWADWFMPAALGAAPLNWRIGTLFRVDYLVPIPMGLPDKPYHIELTARVSSKGELMQRTVKPVTPEQVNCCIRIPAWPALPLSERHDVWDASNARLMQAEFQGVVRSGDILPVALTWNIAAKDTAQWQSVISLEPLIGGTALALSGGQDAASLFSSAPPIGEPVRELKSVQLPYSTVPGFYRLSLTRQFGPGRSGGDGVLLGLVQVQDYPPTVLTRQPQTPISGRVGDLDLIGWSLDQPIKRGVVLNFHTYWQVAVRPTRDGVLFLHLIDPSGKPGPQDDNPPERGKRSTLSYRPGDGIDQVHQLLLPVDAPGGEYRVYAGIYDRAGGQRWPGQQDGMAARDSLIYLGTVTVPKLPAPRAFVPAVINGQ